MGTFSLRDFKILFADFFFPSGAAPESVVERPVTVTEPSAVLEREQLEAIGMDLYSLEVHQRWATGCGNRNRGMHIFEGTKIHL